MLYETPSYLLSDNGSKFVGKFFDTLCSHPGTKHVKTTIYHPQTNGNVERYIKMTVTILRHFPLMSQPINVIEISLCNS